VLIAWLGFPALITTLATYYAYRSLALVINDRADKHAEHPVAYSLTGAVEIR